MDLNARGGAFTSKVTFSGDKEVSVEAVIDTGSNMTFLAEDSCLDTGLEPDGSRGILCVHGKREDMFVFKGKLKLAGKIIESRVVALPSKTIILPGTETKALLGRDALKEFDLHMNWPSGQGSIE